jgi:hypothetical protein
MKSTVNESGRFGIEDPKKGTMVFLASFNCPRKPPVTKISSSPSRIDSSK